MSQYVEEVNDSNFAQINLQAEKAVRERSYQHTVNQRAASLEPTLTGLLQPDTISPAQYFEIFRRNTPLGPERKLMLAILEDAVACFQNYMTAPEWKKRAAFREAEEWILEEDSHWIFSFGNICEVLGLNPMYIRRGLRLWGENKRCLYQEHVKLQ